MFPTREQLASLIIHYWPEVVGMPSRAPILGKINSIHRLAQTNHNVIPMMGGKT